MLQVELYDLRPFLPLPYEAALAPRLDRAQGRVDASRWLVRDLEALQTAAARLRPAGGALAVVGGGAARALVRCLAPGEGVYFPEPSAGSAEALLAETAGRPVALFAAGGLEDPLDRALLRRLTSALTRRDGKPPQAAAALPEGRPLPPEARDWTVLPAPEGPFRALTAEGLLPLAAAGGDAAAVLRGASAMLSRCREASYENPAWRYAAVRYELYRRGWTVEVLSSADPSLSGVLAWRRDLSAGCEGQDNKGLLPAVLDAAASPDGLPQYLLTGRRLLFETALRLGQAPRDPALPPEEDLDFLRDRAQEALLLARTRAGVPCLRIDAAPEDGTPSARAEALGALLAFFQCACALTAGLLDVDPQTRAHPLSGLTASLTGPRPALCGEKM